MRAASVAAVFAAAFLGLFCEGASAGNAPPTEVTRAEHFVKKFEQRVALAKGKPFALRYDEQEATRRVRDLTERFPDDPAVKAVYDRVRVCVRASKGDFVEITPAMLAYRDTEKQLSERIAKVAAEEWAAYRTRLATLGPCIDKPLPSPDPLGTPSAKVVGSTVLLTDFRYPDNEFGDTGQQFVACGSEAQGYYYVVLSSREWIGAYEALKRYRRDVTAELPTNWTLVGRIVGLSLLVPQAGDEKTMSAWFGWRVMPLAIWAPDRVLAVADAAHPEGGTFSGESQLEQIKDAFYTVKTIPADVEPIDLVRILATAIKERNWPLFCDAIDPSNRDSPKAIDRLAYFYDNNLERYRRWYVHVDPFEQTGVRAISGEAAAAGSDEAFFLTAEERAEIERHSGPLVEETDVMVRTFDENGKQSALPHKVVLRRYKKGRWYVYSGYPL